jgi:hypothetical protein
VQAVRPLRTDPVEEADDGDWVVRFIAGGRSEKDYRCPGCNQEIRAGQPHLVTWPADGGYTAVDGPDDRRHWHRPCWQNRTHRLPPVDRTRNAPRYG